MMVGDPSTAKSQLLRHVMDIAPLAINTTGRGSSGVGLTAAVTMDKDTGEKHLEAGAMVLADRGIVCIDEFDKMNDIDRVAIHEVMEQQTVTIAKAGLHVSLNARCSVIAAANPIYGEYARDQPVGKNIGLPDSLLSRFDLLFVMLDEKDAESDRKIAERVITNHRYQQANHMDMHHFNFFNDDVVIEPEMHDDKHEGKGTQVFEKINTKGAHNSKNAVTREFLKKYISFAKAQKAPELHQDCIDYAAQFYSALRIKAQSYDQGKVSVPITVRTLETMIRLSTAHAKLRFSKEVETLDIDVAVKMLNYSIFQENVSAIKEEDDEDEDVYDDPAADQHTTNATGKSRDERYRERYGKDAEITVKKEQTTKSPNKRAEKEGTKSSKKVSFTKNEEKLQQSEEKPKKRMKIDHEEQVSQLFSGK